MKKNDVFTVEITDMTGEGAGVCRIDGTAVFVPFSAVGDKLKILIVKAKKNYAYGKILEIISPAPSRAENDCPVFGKCGGCVFRHINYEAELEIKLSAVRNNLRRIGGVSGDIVEKINAAPDRVCGYRNKAQYPVTESDGRVTAGFFSPRSHRVNPCTDCALQPPEFAAITECICAFLTEKGISAYNEVLKIGLVRHIYLRYAEITGEIMVIIVINGQSLPHSAELCSRLKNLLGGRLKSFGINVNTADTNVIMGEGCTFLYGDPYITDEICGVRVRISPHSFYQVNRTMAERLYKKAAEYAAPQGKTVLDLYCGTGTIGLTMANEAEKIIGVEIVPDAVRDAAANAKAGGITNAEFICADAASAAADLKRRGISADTVIVDPPRKGCSPELLAAVAEGFSPERIVYISCDSATLSRDIKILSGCGYTPVKAEAFDLFPRTAHIETVCLLESGKDKIGN